MSGTRVRLLLEDGTVLAEGVAPRTFSEIMQREVDALWVALWPHVVAPQPWEDDGRKKAPPPTR